MKYIKPAKLLALYSVVNMLLLLIAIFSKGSFAVYAVIAVPFLCR